MKYLCLLIAVFIWFKTFISFRKSPLNKCFSQINEGPSLNIKGNNQLFSAYSTFKKKKKLNIQNDFILQSMSSTRCAFKSVKSGKENETGFGIYICFRVFAMNCCVFEIITRIWVSSRLFQYDRHLNEIW